MNKLERNLLIIAMSDLDETLGECLPTGKRLKVSSETINEVISLSDAMRAISIIKVPRLRSSYHDRSRKLI